MAAVEGVFLEAERRLFELHRLDATTRDLPLADGTTAHVTEVGNGPALVFVPGGGAPGASWAPLLPHLDGFRRIVVDRPGFGLTPAVPHRRETMRDLAVQFLTRVLDALDLPSAPLVGNSMGSWWTTQLALVAPDRVQALVHVGCPAMLLDTSAPRPMRLLGLRGLGDLLQRLQPVSRRQMRANLRMNGDRLGVTPPDEAMIDLMLAMQRLPHHDRAWLDLLHAFIHLRGQRPGVAIGPEDLRSLRSPLLFVWGEHDPYGGPEVGRRAAELVDDGRLVRLPLGHIPWISDAGAVAGPVRDFLRARQTSH